MKNWLPRLLTIATVVIGLRLAASHMPDKKKQTADADKTAITSTEVATSETTSMPHSVSAIIQKFVATESANVNELISDLQKASPHDLLKVSEIALSKEHSNEVRQKAVYALSHLGAQAIPALTVIATTPMTEARTSDPHSAATYKFKEEVGLRITAIEALDRLSAENPEVKSSMQLVLQNQSDRTLTLLAQISLSGIESGHPGKVQRAIQTLLKENN